MAFSSNAAELLLSSLQEKFVVDASS